MKTCKLCLVVKPLSDFAKRSVASDGYNSKCRECANEYHRQWNAKNPERVKHHNRNRVPHPGYDKERWYSTRKYSNHGLTKEAYDEMVQAQNGVCTICESPPKKSFHIDHDHDCCGGNFGCAKCVRGLLCERCNRALGQFEDDPDLLERAIQYLVHHADNRAGPR